MSAVWAWVEGDPEVMGDAADLAQELGVPAYAVAAGADPDVLAGAGAERVAVLDAPYDAEVHAVAVSGCVGAPAAVLLPGTADGSDLAPRLAVRLDAACLLDCASIRRDRRGLVVLRWAYDDRAHERWLVPAGLPLVATLRPGGRGAPRPRPRRARVTRLRAPGGRPRARLLRRLPPDPGSVRLGDAERIVAAGLGVGSRESLGQVEELAGHLRAALGASRPLADRGWVPFERQIGTTGQQVAPRLYVAVGISGAAQHVAGIRDAETIVAINTDPTCPMMARASLAAVGDAGQVVPALLARLRGLSEAPAASP